MKLDLNCDLGEGESQARTRALMSSVTSANVACGAHAGDLRSQQACVRLARECGVHLGAHPGPWSRADFGRGALRIRPDELELLLLQQVSALERIARSEGVRLHHLKLHGSLYHAVEASPVLARRYLHAARKWWPHCFLYVRAGGLVARIARESGVVVWEEVFADRAYRAAGSLVPRECPGAVLTSIPGILDRVQRLQQEGKIRTESGRLLQLRPRTVCLHSDTPDAVRIARALAQRLRLR